MAKFRRSSASVAIIGANTLTCVLDVSYDESGDVLVSDCDDVSGKKEQVLGGVVKTGTLTAEVAKTDEVQLGYIDPGTSGTWTDKPAGITGGDIVWTATLVTIASRRFMSSRGNLATYECSLIFSGLDHAAI